MNTYPYGKQEMAKISTQSSMLRFLTGPESEVDMIVRKGRALTEPRRALLSFHLRRRAIVAKEMRGYTVLG